MSSKKNKSKKKSTPAKSPSKGKSQPAKKKRPAKKKKKAVRKFECWSVSSTGFGVDLWSLDGHIDSFDNEEIVVSLLDSHQKPIMNDDDEILSFVGGLLGWIDSTDFGESMQRL